MPGIANHHAAAEIDDQRRRGGQLLYVANRNRSQFWRMKSCDDLSNRTFLTLFDIRETPDQREGDSMSIVRFAAYRQYEKSRVEASNAMMALLAGAQLSSHLLRLTDGSQRLLPEVYPRVPHIGRFNLTSEAARAILDAADTHLGAMSVPYALAIHEDYLKTCLGLLARAGCCPQGTADSSNLANQHSVISASTNGSFSADSLAQINTLRLMRNCVIHRGGRASTTLINDLAAWSAKTEAGWVKLAKRNPRTLRVGDLVTFGHAEMILTLAVTKALDRKANELLQPALSRPLWADLVIEDLMESYPSADRASDGLRKARGLARHYYGPLALTESELKAALFRV